MHFLRCLLLIINSLYFHIRLCSRVRKYSCFILFIILQFHGCQFRCKWNVIKENDCFFWFKKWIRFAWNVLSKLFINSNNNRRIIMHYLPGGKRNRYCVLCIIINMNFLSFRIKNLGKRFSLQISLCFLSLNRVQLLLLTCHLMS